MRRGESILVNGVGRWAVGVDAGDKSSRFLQSGLGASDSLS